MSKARDLITVKLADDIELFAHIGEVASLSYGLRIAPGSGVERQPRIVHLKLEEANFLLAMKRAQ